MTDFENVLMKIIHDNLPPDNSNDQTFPVTEKNSKTD